MDTSKTTDEIRVKVAADIERIKTRMPNVYAEIQAKAAKIGSKAFNLVKRGCAGQPNAFYAFEAGHVVGTPFSKMDIPRETAYLMVAFGVMHLTMWDEEAVQAPAPAGEAAHGTH